VTGKTSSSAHGSTSKQIAAWRAFLIAHARVTATLERELMAERGMPLAWYDVLVQLSEAEGAKLRMHDLARLIVLSRAGLTRLVDRMAAARLVERAPCADDRRGVFVAMTPAGRAALDAASPVHLRGVQEHFTRRLSAAQLASLRESLERVTAALEE
jgi:DNA-binding MarR family transcriptional regulator